MKGITLSISLTVSLLFLSSCRESNQAGGAGAPPEDIGLPTWPDRMPETLNFKKHVRPILVINCLECHNPKDAPKNMGLNLQTKKAAMTSGVNAPVIIPGDPDKSLLIQMLKRNPSHEWAMPPTPDRIWGVRLQILERWIREGAQWPDDLVLEHPADVVEW